jgi:tRNA threonylcarbamoyladenosine biosynthesis protein TsaB
VRHKMLILAFDTTSEHGGAAIFQDEECLASVANEGPANTYSVTLFQMVDHLVAEVRSRADTRLKALSDIGLFAVTNGPGSFTGIRVGLAAAQGWAKAFGRPVRGVSVLEAMVEEARPGTEMAVPILNARRGEFYLQAFKREAEEGVTRFTPAGDGLVLTPEGVSRFIAERATRGCSVTCLVCEHDGAAISLRANLPAEVAWRSIPGNLLRAVARLALRAANRGELASAADLDACYIRRSDAELNWKG